MYLLFEVVDDSKFYVLNSIKFQQNVVKVHIPPVMEFPPNIANVAKRPQVTYFVNQTCRFLIAEPFGERSMTSCKGTL